MNKRKILITNGSGGCGKDTFANKLDNHKNIRVFKVSSIDFVRNMVNPFVAKEKDEKYRKLLSDIKKAFVEYNEVPYNIMVQEIQDFFTMPVEYLKSPQGLLIIDIREPLEIQKIVDFVTNEYDKDNVATVLLTNNNVKQINSNDSDKFVIDYNYDYYIDNSGTLEELQNKATNLLKDMGYLVD